MYVFIIFISIVFECSKIRFNSRLNTDAQKVCYFFVCAVVKIAMWYEQLIPNFHAIHLKFKNHGKYCVIVGFSFTDCFFFFYLQTIFVVDVFVASPMHLLNILADLNRIHWPNDVSELPIHHHAFFSFASVSLSLFCFVSFGVCLSCWQNEIFDGSCTCFPKIPYSSYVSRWAIIRAP